MWAGRPFFMRIGTSQESWAPASSRAASTPGQSRGSRSSTLASITVAGVPSDAAVDAVSARDYPMVVGIILVISVLFVALNLVVDLIYAALDPRVRHG